MSISIFELQPLLRFLCLINSFYSKYVSCVHNLWNISPIYQIYFTYSIHSVIISHIWCLLLSFCMCKTSLSCRKGTRTQVIQTSTESQIVSIINTQLHMVSTRLCMNWHELHIECDRCHIAFRFHLSYLLLKMFKHIKLWNVCIIVFLHSNRSSMICAVGVFHRITTKTNWTFAKRCPTNQRKLHAFLNDVFPKTILA